MTKSNKPSNITSSFDMIRTALELADTINDGYVYNSAASSLAWSFINNTNTINNLNGRRRLSGPQEDLLDNLTRDIHQVETLLNWAHYQTVSVRGQAPVYDRTLENLANWKTKDELKAEADVMYAVLPESKRTSAVSRYVETMYASAENKIVEYEHTLEVITAQETDKLLEPNWFLTSFVINGIHRNLLDYSTVEGIEKVSERVGFDAETKTQHILALPIAEYALEQIEEMQLRIEEHTDRANGESGSAEEMH